MERTWVYYAEADAYKELVSYVKQAAEKDRKHVFQPKPCDFKSDGTIFHPYDHKEPSAPGIRECATEAGFSVTSLDGGESYALDHHEFEAFEHRFQHEARRGAVAGLVCTPPMETFIGTRLRGLERGSQVWAQDDRRGGQGARQGRDLYGAKVGDFDEAGFGLGYQLCAVLDLLPRQLGGVASSPRDP